MYVLHVLLRIYDIRDCGKGVTFSNTEYLAVHGYLQAA